MVAKARVVSVPAESPKVPVALFYNPDWLSDDDLLNGFTARLPLLDFLRDELCRSPLRGTVQHMLLVGVRGSGKTTLLKRLAVAIRRETGLADHLVALSFPEELYQVKGLADLWWAACEALEDALHEAGEHLAAAALTVRIEAERFERPIDDVHDEHALRLLLQTCSSIGRRPVLLIDNLDLVLDRIDKSGRKTQDPHSRAYWALREALSSADAPIVIGGSARLGEPLVGYDKAFYDFFVPHRLGKLTLEETRDVFDHLAERQGGDELRQRIRRHLGRVQALYEMTGGNPRALILIFELLRQGVTSRAVDDFERLLDLTTPYYKSRFEELPEQAQIVMHALAMSRREPSGSNYGHTASIIARRAGLETRTVSSQLEVLIKAGVVEKSKADGDRTRYRIGEQLFRLWLQMRSSRRIRAQVVGLTEFLEALFGRDEVDRLIRDELSAFGTASAHGHARMRYALSELQQNRADRRYLQSHAVESRSSVTDIEGRFQDAFEPGDLDDELEELAECRSLLSSCLPGLKALHDDPEMLARTLVGALSLSTEEKVASAKLLCNSESAAEEMKSVSEVLFMERFALKHDGLSEQEIDLLYGEREFGRLVLSELAPSDLELCTNDDVRQLVWKLLCASRTPLHSSEQASDWLAWADHHFPRTSSEQWAEFACACRTAGHWRVAETALERAFGEGESARALFEHAMILENNRDIVAAEAAYRKAIELDPTDTRSWNLLGTLIAEDATRQAEAETVFRKAIETSPANSWSWASLGNLLAKDMTRHDEAESSFRLAIKLDSTNMWPYMFLGDLLGGNELRHAEAEVCYRKAIELDPLSLFPWIDLGNFLVRDATRRDEAVDAFRKTVELEPTDPLLWNNLGLLLADDPKRRDDAEAVFERVLTLDQDNSHAKWCLTKLHASRAIDSVTMALKSREWEQVETALKDLRAHVGLEPGWPASDRFVQGVVTTALESGQGLALLTLLRDLDFETIAAPLLMALEATIEDDRERLSCAEPEMRSAALRLFDQLRAWGPGS